jgi:ABC-type dipeptide/oligopeptide/nickel transport system permease subunit
MRPSGLGLLFARTWLLQVALRAPTSAWLGAAGLLFVWALGMAGLWLDLEPALLIDPQAVSSDPQAPAHGLNAAHWLGTDRLGRDVFWRLLLAAQVFVAPGVLSAALAMSLAVPLGALAGWSGGGLARAVFILLGAVASVPQLVLVLMCGTIFGHDPAVLAISAGVSATPALARAVAERIERLRVEEFVLASRAHGLSTARILLLHLVAIASGRAIARHLVGVFGAFMVLECTLSYLGNFGVQEPTPSWGNMLTFQWGRPISWSILAPGLAIWATLGACALAARLFAEVDDD